MTKAHQSPEKIYGWMDTQLSIARFYGSISYQNQTYHIAQDEPGQPLVRWDVLQREQRQRRLEKEQAQAEQAALQGRLL